ncbi:MAG: helix-turn-helix domain-containing protein [Terrimesophilobacter sp.]
MASVNRAEPPVKGSRSYDSARRRSQAERSRRAVVEAARARFLDSGYASTTIADVARDAHISPETIYKAFRSKAGLLRAVREAALAGTETTPAEQRADAALDAETDPRAVLTGWAKLACEVAPRVAPILLLVRAAAAADPSLVPLDLELDRLRLDRAAHLAAELRRHGHSRPDLTPDQVRDVLYTFTSPELFHVLIEDRGWAVDDFGRFLARSMIATILPTAPD